jgi:alginate O-acetyltransferase complex protein AlgI
VTFSSLAFICVFLPCCLAVYFALPRLRNAALIGFSLAFYAYGEPVYVLLLLLSAAANWLLGIIIGDRAGTPRARPALVLAVILNLAPLALFKYTALSPHLPLGISFYTFRALSYVIDVYRGEVKGQRSFWGFLLYFSMFPQLIAGPIVRYADIEAQLQTRKLTLRAVSSGITRFSVGLGKKVLLANAAGRAVTLLLGAGVKMTVLGNWLGVVFFAFQLYFDFSGYSDMAIGLGRILGFEFKENFVYPYISRSITEFWRRWHISLGSFFRDYVYIPLGGNRRHQILNLLIVWLLTGMWHGAGWNFLLWGAYYGALLILEKFVLKNALERLPSALRRVYSCALILLGWAIFYFTDIAGLAAFLRGAVGIGAELYDFRVGYAFLSNAFLLVILVLASTPLPAKFAAKIREKRVLGAATEPLFNAIILAASFTAIVGSTFNPFLYFRF